MLKSRTVSLLFFVLYLTYDINWCDCANLLRVCTRKPWLAAISHYKPSIVTSHGLSRLASRLASRKDCKPAVWNSKLRLWGLPQRLALTHTPDLIRLDGGLYTHTGYTCTCTVWTSVYPYIMKSSLNNMRRMANMSWAGLWPGSAQEPPLL